MNNIQQICANVEERKTSAYMYIRIFNGAC